MSAIAFYARAWQLSHFLLFQAGRQDQFRDYLHGLDRGETSLAAAQRAFGDLQVLQREARMHYANHQIQGLLVPALRIRAGSITIRTLPPGQGAMMLIHARSQSGVTTRTAPAVLADAIQTAAPYPTDPVVQTMLAEAALDAGDIDFAEVATDRALKADPACTAALVEKALIVRRRAQTSGDRTAWAGIRHWLIAANHSDSDAAFPLLLYYRSYLAEGVRPTPAAVRGLQRAVFVAPESSGARLALAAHDLGEGAVPEARSLLAPIAYAPHGGPWQQVALGVIGRLDTASPQDAGRTLDAASASFDWNEGD